MVHVGDGEFVPCEDADAEFLEKVCAKMLAQKKEQPPARADQIRLHQQTPPSWKSARIASESRPRKADETQAPKRPRPRRFVREKRMRNPLARAGQQPLSPHS